MNNFKTVASLFDKSPHQWGVRGDPHLWNEMRQHFAQTPIPSNAEELIALIQSTFEKLTNHSMSEQDIFYVERFNHGSMSGGFVSPEFWRNKFMPLIREQYGQVKNELP